MQGTLQISCGYCFLVGHTAFSNKIWVILMDRRAIDNLQATNILHSVFVCLLHSVSIPLYKFLFGCTHTHINGERQRAYAVCLYLSLYLNNTNKYVHIYYVCAYVYVYTHTEAYFIVFVILLPKYCIFYQLKVCSDPVSSRSISLIFPTTLVHFLSLCHN